MSARTAGKDWDKAQLDELRRRWLAGESTAQIGVSMRRTKNAIVGKAHRMNLPPRPSPIIRGAPPKQKRHVNKPRPKVTLPSLLTPQPAAVPVVAAEPVLQASTPAAAAAPTPATPRIAPPRPPALIRHCLWPLGDPKDRTFRFCDKAILPRDGVSSRSPYCDEHAALSRSKSNRCGDDAV